MRSLLCMFLATLAVATIGVTAPATAAAAPAGPSSVAATTAQLQRNCYDAIVNRFGDAQAEHGILTAVHP